MQVRVVVSGSSDGERKVVGVVLRKASIFFSFHSSPVQFVERGHQAWHYNGTPQQAPRHLQVFLKRACTLPMPPEKCNNNSSELILFLLYSCSKS